MNRMVKEHKKHGRRVLCIFTAVIAAVSMLCFAGYCFYFTGNHVLFLILPYGCSNTTVASSDNFGYRVLSSYFLRFCG